MATKSAKVLSAPSLEHSLVVSEPMHGKHVIIANKSRAEKRDDRKTSATSVMIVDVVVQNTTTDTNHRIPTDPMRLTTMPTFDNRVKVVVRHWSRYKVNVVVMIQKTVMRHVDRGKKQEDCVELPRKR